MEIIEVKASKNYNIYIQDGLLDDLKFEYNKIALITDDIVDELYAGKLENVYTHKFVFQNGEQSKSVKTLTEIWSFLTENNFTRSDLIIALGGGVVGDVAGFAASTYLRGVPFVQIPTTLLAMVDSSVGGKTAVNIPEGKNLVGSFYQPNAVYIDPKVLSTQQNTDFADGIAEVVKYGMIKDKTLFALLENNNLQTIKEHIIDVIKTCVKIKSEIVAADEFDKSERMLLNFGHTLGHAIEKIGNFTTYTHGQAVSMGMCIITRHYCDTEVADRLEKTLNNYYLPTETDDDVEKILKCVKNDKKNFGDKLTYVICKEIGKGELVTIKGKEFLFGTKLNAEFWGEPLVLTSESINKNAKIDVPSSKSIAHRALICSYLAGGNCEIKNLTVSDDIQATINALNALDGDNITIDCKESGSTLRFLIPLVAALGKTATFVGEGRLPNRPLTPYVEELSKKGISFTAACLPFTMSGQLMPGKFSFAGNISSQFISGLLFALPLLEGHSEIDLTTNLESAPYVDLTLDCLSSFGVEIVRRRGDFLITGVQKYKPAVIEIEGDYSQGAFPLAANFLGANMEINGLPEKTLQGDKKILEILEEIKYNSNVIEINAENIPDLVPLLAVVGSFSKSGMIISGASRLKLKESNRILAISEALNSIGGNITHDSDGLTIQPVPHFTGGEVTSRGDHRIAMAVAIASLKSIGDIVLYNYECVSKSYPTFWNDFLKN
ncbi:MAG: 3-dehydroquinate synthase [Ruminococcus sp.]|jgi:3-dehydroquinate synthase/3-phosphoshikimate 1-carboxyvinyltransferase|nr:3-dehydroquinate synthase [Ruminococcus sp.]